MVERKSVLALMETQLQTVDERKRDACIFWKIICSGRKEVGACTDGKLAAIVDERKRDACIFWKIICKPWNDGRVLASGNHNTPRGVKNGLP